jgi:hypothetical protein
VTRVGTTVRRPQGPGSDAVHALLRHLEERGFAGAPRHLGEDAGGREVLSYVEGEVPIQPTPAWAHEDSALVSVGDLLRRYHEAVADFDPTPLRWRTRVPDRWRRGVVSHNDPNLDNVVFRDGEAVALIDFDLASPGCPAWDLATAARLWVPLIDPRDVPPALAGRAEERLRLLLDAAGADDELREDVVAAVPLSLTWGYDVVRDGAAGGNEAYADYWTRAQQRYRRGVTWLEDNADRLRRAALRR